MTMDDDDDIQGEKDLTELLAMCQTLVDRYKPTQRHGTASPDDLIEMILSCF
jgi:hypothetical protein